MNHHYHHSRRRFLEQLGLGCASVGATSLLSGITNLGLINAAVAANKPVYKSLAGNYKAIVCIMLSGGNDSYNMLVPKGDAEHAEYAAVRTNIALDKNTLRPINPINSIGKELGLHPNLENIQGLFEDGDAAFIANVGALVQPTTVTEFKNATHNPVGLFSHSDQKLHWQTCVPQNRDAKGWGGRLADILYTNNVNQDISMNISLNGVNTFQRGNIITEYAIESSGGGSVSINGSNRNNFYNTLKRQTLDSILETSYQNILESAYARTISDSKNNAIQFSAALAQGTPFTTPFGNDSLSERLQMVTQVIAAKDQLDVTNQTFFVQQSGYDNHDNNIVAHGDLMSQLDAAVGSFYTALTELSMQDDVLIFTASDFARKLVSNGDGSDHAWGGHSMVIGGSVIGKKIYGTYPDLYIDNPLDAGNGRIVPTTSCDELFAEMALWMGASTGDLDEILPNIENFWTPSPTGMPLGFLPV
ncbi:MAG: DUF1501 domain-containing protein [Saprospiraceae bacterium]